MRRVVYITGFLMVVASLSTVVMAIQPVPEIDGGSISNGLGLLTGSILMLRARFGKK
jgi:hypothetical protein